MSLYSINLLVDAAHQWEARDLANAMQAAIRTAQKSGRYDAVTVISGPELAAMQPVQPGNVFVADADGIIRFPAVGTCSRGDHPAGTPCNGYPSATCAGFES